MPPICEAQRLTWMAAFVAILGILGGPAGAATITQGVVEIGGVQRSYTMYLPAGFDAAKRYPIVLGLHGGLGNGERFAQQSGLPNYVDQRNFIAVFPNANGKQWNDGRATTRSSTDDVAFLLMLVRQVTAANGGDPQRVFVTGVSNGGMMAQRLICDAADVVAGVAVVIANLPADIAGDCRPKRPVPIAFFNGVADPLMPWAGGDIRKAPGLGVGGKAMSTPQTVAFWAGANGCRSELMQNLPGRAADGTKVRLHTFESCSGAPVLLYEIQGGGHAWPGSAVPKLAIVRRIVGTTSKAIDATQAMLEFFSKFGL